MIRDRLIPPLHATFADKPFVFGEPPDPIASVRAVVPEIGALEIYDDGDEATVSLREITHGHFNPYDSSLTDEETDSWVTHAVLEFLDALFSDHVLLCRSADRGMGGWTIFDEVPDPDELAPGFEYFLWSRPYPNPEA